MNNYNRLRCADMLSGASSVTLFQVRSRKSEFEEARLHIQRRVELSGKNVLVETNSLWLDRFCGMLGFFFFILLCIASTVYLAMSYKSSTIPLAICIFMNVIWFFLQCRGVAFAKKLRKIAK